MCLCVSVSPREISLFTWVAYCAATVALAESVVASWRVVFAERRASASQLLILFYEVRLAYFVYCITERWTIAGCPCVPVVHCHPTAFVFRTGVGGWLVHHAGAYLPVIKSNQLIFLGCVASRLLFAEVDGGEVSAACISVSLCACPGIMFCLVGRWILQSVGRQLE